MRILKPVISVLLLLAIVTSCSTDVDIYADYKDMTIVYGLLDKNDDTTFLKITKAFQGPGNALVFASNPDSSNYSYKLDVKLTGIQNGVEKQTIVFDTITVFNKVAGDSVFYFPKQLVYYSTETLNEDYKYNLSIEKNEGVINAETEIVSDFIITYPNRNINFMGEKDITWRSAEQGKRYEIIMVFHYKELLPGATDTLYKTISWNFGTRKSIGLDGGEEMMFPYNGDIFYSTLQNELEPVLNVRRWTGLVDILITSASQEMDTYIEVNNGSNSLLSEVPVYSNVEGGTGLLASRTTVVSSVPMTSRSEDKLIQEYPDLGFKYKP